jgi:hypothetical protein
LLPCASVRFHVHALRSGLSSHWYRRLGLVWMMMVSPHCFPHVASHGSVYPHCILYSFSYAIPHPSRNATLPTSAVYITNKTLPNTSPYTHTITRTVFTIYDKKGHDTAPGADHVLSEHLRACFVNGETWGAEVWAAVACTACPAFVFWVDY